MNLQKPSDLTPTEAQTWDRVFSGCQKEQTAGSEDQLLQLIADEQADCLAYRQMASGCRKGRAVLLELSADEACHARRLSARYYVQTGQWPEVKTPETQSQQTMPEDLCQALRTHYRQELAGARTYAVLAQSEIGDRRNLFEELAKDELRHSRAIMKLLEC